jgi:hypothetical protein
LNVAGALVSARRPDWSTIATYVGKQCCSVAEREANLAVGQALYSFATQQNIVGRPQSFFPLAIGVGYKVTYWIDAVIVIAGRPYVVFIDPRKHNKLTRIGRQFALSVMHQRIRLADPDFEDVGLLVVQLDVADDGSRTVRPFYDTGIELFEFEALDAMVRETYQIWAEVLAEREADEREIGRGKKGSLL